MLTRWIREALVLAWRRLTRDGREQTAADEASRRAVLSRARFWAELREGQHDAAIRSKR